MKLREPGYERYIGCERLRTHGSYFYRHKLSLSDPVLFLFYFILFILFIFLFNLF